LQLSLFYFADDSTADAAAGRYQLLLDGARFADAHGFAAVWTPERHFHPFGGLYPNPSVTGAAVAAVTSRVGIRAGSVVGPLHDPLRIAEEWSVVDNLSGGRVAVSFASGWHPADFGLRPEAYRDRKAILESTVDDVLRLWRGGTVTRTDGKGETRELRMYPPPVQERLPIWLTTTGSTETFQLAGRLGAGILTHVVRQEFDALAANIAEYRKAGGNHVTLMVHTFLGPDREQVRAAVHDPMCEYLESSLGLITKATNVLSRHGTEPAALRSRLDQVREHAFDRYFESGGLFGSVEDGVRAARYFAGLGVDELACLIDFGLPVAEVLDGLVYLNKVREAVVDGGDR
jgi:natural product biosynthesis luciferase-like monooxygenase protein